MWHKNAFYVLLKGYTAKKKYTSILLTKKRYKEINVWEKYLERNIQPYAWVLKYDIILFPKAESSSSTQWRVKFMMLNCWNCWLLNRPVILREFLSTCWKSTRMITARVVQTFNVQGRGMEISQANLVGNSDFGFQFLGGAEFGILLPISELRKFSTGKNWLKNVLSQKLEFHFQFQNSGN